MITEVQRAIGPDDSGPQDSTRRVDSPATVDTPTKPNGHALSEAERHEVKQLERIDREPRAHEKAHQITGGPYVGSPSYEYQRARTAIATPWPARCPSTTER
nr:putative metalloprotease CJM1_0395 family protein [Halomonas nitroreducens]